MRILRRKTKSKNVKGYDLVFCSSEDGMSVMNRNGGKHEIGRASCRERV